MQIDLYEWLDPGYDIIGKYTYVDPVAHGRIGLILKVRDKDGGEFALKTIRPKTRRLSTGAELVLLEASLAAEFRLMSAFRHENIIAAREILRDPRLGSCIVMEYAPGGNLQKRIEDRVIARSESLYIFEHLMDVLAILHQPGVDFTGGIVHLDLESKNIVFDENGTPKLCDFHYAREIRREKSVSNVSVDSAVEIDVRTDLYQLGRLLYEMLCYGSSDWMDLGRIPIPIRPLIAGLIARDPARPYQNIQEVSLAYRALDVRQSMASQRAPAEPCL
jgi:serine/threonine protein kinase